MNEQQARTWIKSVGAVVLEGTSITNTAIDDTVVKMFFDALDNDMIWGLMWPIIDGIFEESPLTKSDTEFVAAAEAAAIDPMTIIAIVTAIFELWRKFRR